MSKQTFMMLSAYDRENDGQLLKMDQLIPESTYLGAVWSDHLGAALAMGTKFPRAALFESVVRYVLDDLATKPGAKPVDKPADNPAIKSTKWWEQ